MADSPERRCDDCRIRFIPPFAPGWSWTDDSYPLPRCPDCTVTHRASVIATSRKQS